MKCLNKMSINRPANKNNVSNYQTQPCYCIDNKIPLVKIKKHLFKNVTNNLFIYIFTFTFTIGELNYRYETGVGDSFRGGNKWVVYYFLNTLTDFHCYFDYGIC